MHSLIKSQLEAIPAFPRRFIISVKTRWGEPCVDLEQIISPEIVALRQSNDQIDRMIYRSLSIERRGEETLYVNTYHTYCSFINEVHGALQDYVQRSVRRDGIRIPLEVNFFLMNNQIRNVLKDTPNDAISIKMIDIYRYSLTNNVDSKTVVNLIQALVVKNSDVFGTSLESYKSSRHSRITRRRRRW